MALDHALPLKARLAHKFFRSISKIQTRRSGRPLSSEQIGRRRRRIKIAAYSSMAFAVGSKRAWSQALARKLRSGARKGGSFGTVKKEKRVRENKPSRMEPSRAHKLRRLVPGGKGMEFCDLLEETADYIKCLATQVKVMKSMVDLYSN